MIDIFNVERHIDQDPGISLDTPLVVKMKNGYIFEIKTAKMLFPDLIKRAFTDTNRSEIKFCTVDDEEALDLDKDSESKREHYKLIFFPMYINGEEIAHDVVDN